MLLRIILSAFHNNSLFLFDFRDSVIYFKVIKCRIIVLLSNYRFCCPASCIRVGVNAFHPPSNRLVVARSSRRISNQLFRLSCVAFPASARNTTPGPYTKWFCRLAIWSISVGSSREPNFRGHTGKTKTRYPWLGKLYCPMWCVVVLCLYVEWPLCNV